MLITTEQQEAWVVAYVRQKHTQDECIGFIDGISKAFEVMALKLNKEKDATEIALAEQKVWVDEYNKSNRTIGEREGFVDGINKVLEVINIERKKQEMDNEEILLNFAVSSISYSVYQTELEKIKQLPQTQTSLFKQCEILRDFANKLGLYDAADFLRK